MADFARHCSAMIQGEEEFSDVLNTPDIVTTPLTGLPDTYTHIFQFVGGASREGLTWARDGANQTAPTANHIIEAFYVRWSDISPTVGGEYRFFAVVIGTGTDITATASHSLALILETDGDIRVVDDADGTIDTITTPLTVDTWHRFEVRFLPSETIGEVQIWIDGTEVLANQTSLDLSTFVRMDNFSIGGPTNSSDGNMFFAGASTIINSSAASDRLDDDFEIVGPYSIGQTGATPDGTGGNTGTPPGNDAGDDLDGDGALWETTAEIPFSDETQDTDAAEYDGTPLDGSCYCDGGTRGGPSGDGDVDGDSNIKSAQYTFRAERGTGGGTTHSFYFGNATDAGGSAGKHDQALTVSPVNHTVVSEDAAVMPLSTQNARIGFGVSGAQNMYMHEMVCTLLHVPDAGGPNTEALTATATGVPAIQLIVAKTLASTAIGSSQLNRLVKKQPFIATAVGVVTIATLRTAFVTVAAVATGVVNLARKVRIGLGPTATGIVALGRKIFKTLDVSATGIAAIITLPTFRVALVNTATGIAGLIKKAKLGLAASATGIAIIRTISTFRRLLTATATGVANLQRKSKITLANTASGIASIVVDAVSALNKTALAVTATAIAALQLKTKKTLASTASGIAVLVDIPTFRILVATAATGIAVLLKKAKLGLSVSATGVVTIGTLATFRRLLAATAVGVVDLQRKMKLNLRSTATGVVAVVVNALEGATLLTLTAAATAIAVLRITVKKTLQVSSAGVATLVDIPTFRVLLANAATGIAILIRIPTFKQVFSVVATGIAGIAKKPKITLAVTAVGAAAINRTMFKTLRSTAEGLATLAVFTARFISLAAVAAGIPTLVLKVRRGLSATGAGVANIGKFVSKTLRVTATGVVNVTLVGPGGVPEAVEAIKRRIIGFFGGPGQGPGR